MKPLWPLKCEHNFEVPGCEICNRYPTLEAWLQSPECERVCERIEMGVARTADLLAATWTAATAQLCQRIERLEQQIRVEQRQVQLAIGKIAPSQEYKPGEAMNALGIRIVENAALNGGDILVVHEGKAWLCHNGVWSEIPDYAESARAWLDTLMQAMLKYPA